MKRSRDKTYQRHMGHNKNPNRIRDHEDEIKQLQPALIRESETEEKMRLKKE